MVAAVAGWAVIFSVFWAGHLWWPGFDTWSAPFPVQIALGLLLAAAVLALASWVDRRPR